MKKENEDLARKIIKVNEKEAEVEGWRNNAWMIMRYRIEGITKERKA